MISLSLASTAGARSMMQLAQSEAASREIAMLMPAARTVPNRRALSDPRSRYDAIIRELAERYGVEAALVKAVIHVESGFDSQAVSRRGARGLMQLMPAVARAHGVSDAHDPRQNIRGGVKQLRALLERFHHDPRLAVAAYNAGSRAVARFRGLPPFPETRRYVQRVLRVERQYRAESGLSQHASGFSYASPPATKAA